MCTFQLGISPKYRLIDLFHSENETINRETIQITWAERSFNLIGNYVLSLWVGHSVCMDVRLFAVWAYKM